jgi:hypothetical protein
VSRVKWDATKNEIILWFTTEQPNFQVDANVAFTIAIEGIDTLERKPAIGVLNAMADEVKRVLLVTEEECLRLGFKPPDDSFHSRPPE